MRTDRTPTGLLVLGLAVCIGLGWLVFMSGGRLAPLGAGAFYWPWIIPAWWVVRRVPAILGGRALAWRSADAVFLSGVVLVGTLLTALTHLMPGAVGVGVGVAHDLDLFDLLGETYEFREHLELEGPSPLPVEIRNVEGSVRVAPSPDQRLWLDVTTRVRASDVDQAETLVRSLVFEIEEANGRYRIRSNRDDMTGEMARRFRTGLEVRVPASTPVTVFNSRGSVETQDLASPQTIYARDGGVLAETGSGSVEAHVRRGDMRIVFGVAPPDTVSLSAIDGDVRLELPSESGFTIVGDVWSGSFESDFDVVSAASSADAAASEDRLRVDAQVRGGGGNLRFDVHGGQMELVATRPWLRMLQGLGR